MLSLLFLGYSLILALTLSVPLLNGSPRRTSRQGPILVPNSRLVRGNGLYTEAHEPSLTTRRLKLSLNYVLKLKSLLENPAYSCVFEPENTKLFEESESKTPPLGIRIFPDLEKSKLNLNLVDDAPSLDIVPWKLSVPAVRLDLTNFKKDTTNPEIYKQFYLQLISKYPSDFLMIFLIHRRF